MNLTLSKIVLLAVALSGVGCTLPRTADTDRWGWTNPTPSPGPSLENHSPTPGHAPYYQGQQPVSQPDGYSPKGSIEGRLGNSRALTAAY